MFTPEELAALAAPFALDEHTVREGFRNKAKTSMRWFVYVKRHAVVDRLNQIFPGEWSTPQPELHTLGKTVSATVGITIRGITRWDGGDDDTGEGAKDALTNGFRRTAAYGWTVGLYLYTMEFELYTNAYPEGDWKAREEREKEAWAKFTQWYHRMFGTARPVGSDVTPTAPVVPPAKNETPNQPPPAPPTYGKSQDKQPPKPNEIRTLLITSMQTATQAQTNKAYYRLTANTGETAFAFSRDVFRNWGYKEADIADWNKPGTRKQWQSPLKIKAQFQPDSEGGGFWQYVDPIKGAVNEAEEVDTTGLADKLGAGTDRRI